MKIRKQITLFLTIFFSFIFITVDNIYALTNNENNFEVIVRPSKEPHLGDGTIGYVYMGINSGSLWWGTTKFEMSIDGGKNMVLCILFK